MNIGFIHITHKCLELFYKGDQVTYSHDNLVYVLQHALFWEYIDSVIMTFDDNLTELKSEITERIRDNTLLVHCVCIDNYVWSRVVKKENRV